MKVPRLKLENLMALDMADAGVLKRNVVRLLLRNPQGIKYGDFSGAFCKLHGHHPQLALHGYSSLKYLLTDMKDMVVLKKNSQATIIKLAAGVTLNCWLNKEKEMRSLMDEKGPDVKFVPPLPSIQPQVKLTTMVETPNTAPATAAAVVPTLSILQGYPIGLNLQTLAENLKKHRFDLERFSQDMGYSDTLQCLLEMPGLHLTFLNWLMPHNSVVKCPSRSPGPKAMPLSAGCWQKPLYFSDSGKKPAPEESLALLTNLTKKGMKVKQLEEHLLALAGFDLEKFCIAQGYIDTLEFLEHQMPELSIKYCGSRLECVVKQGKGKKKVQEQHQDSQKKMRKRQGKKKAQKCQESQEKMSKTLAEVLALLTDLLNAYNWGVSVKKLQEFLVTEEGFDLQKFSIAHGYKDTLEFLEHQMPELNIKYHGNRLNSVVNQHRAKQRETKEEQKNANQRIEVLELELRSYNLRFRGIPEELGELDLEKGFQKLIQDFLKVKHDFPEIEHIFRINSKYASQNKLPRDILVSFADKKWKDTILIKQRKKLLTFEGQQVQIFQDLPLSIIKKRKEFGNLTQVLQKRQIRYHWKIPFALEIFLIEGKKIITTVEQAELFVQELLAKDKYQCSGLEDTRNAFREEGGIRKGKEKKKRKKWMS